MTSVLLASLLALVAVEYVVRMPFSREGKKLLDTARKSTRVLRSRHISDHWKERVIANYAVRVFKATVYLGALLLGLFAGLVGGGFLLDALLGTEPTVVETLADPVAWVWMTVAAFAYVYLRKIYTSEPQKKNSDYSAGDRLLHRLALGSPVIGKISLEFDQLVSKNVTETDMAPPVFISGLARAGTTILMRSFYDAGDFRSLTYRDMPFVLMPGVWQKLSGRFHLHEAEKERAHADGISVNFDSPEAFEEVFWRVFTGEKYLSGKSLSPYPVDHEIIELFRQYVSQVVSSSGSAAKRYLSKNNNNVLRLDSIRKAFPQALILTPFRDPFQHANSLLRLHNDFVVRQSEDSFTREYMGWLGHHEFGATHRPFEYPGFQVVKAGCHKPDNINYWLATWINTYAYLLETAPTGTIFVCFEELCRNPEQTMGILFSRAGLSSNNSTIAGKIRPPVHVDVNGIDPDLSVEASRLYDKLVGKALKPG